MLEDDVLGNSALEFVVEDIDRVYFPTAKAARKVSSDVGGALGEIGEGGAFGEVGVERGGVTS